MTSETSHPNPGGPDFEPVVRILTVVGARPQFIKAAAFSRAVAEWTEGGERPRVVERILHTGQHYDPEMSEVFFGEMGIPAPEVNLEVGSGSHGQTTACMLEGIEAELIANRPDWVLVYGDTNSTLAAALAACKLHIPVAHVEAGLRSFNMRMPEEVNRILTDRVSSLLFCPTHAAVEHLAREGVTAGVSHTGDIMADCARVFGELARKVSTVLDTHGLEEKGYVLSTVHRAENTDDPERLQGIFQALRKVAETTTVVLPLHPRTRSYLVRLGLDDMTRGIELIEPVGFLDMVRLEQGAQLILTDSGGVQKEAYFHRVPCVTLRDETEWVETVEAGWNQIVGADPEKILAACARAGSGEDIPEYGDGHAAELMLRTLVEATEAI